MEDVLSCYTLANFQSKKALDCAILFGIPRLPARGGHMHRPANSIQFFFRNLIRLLLIAVTAIMPVCRLHAQSAASTGRLEGTITDPSGAAVPDVGIIVQNQNTGISTTVQSSSEGEFSALNLDPGSYQ